MAVTEASRADTARTDVIVAGAGAAGLIAAIALARSGFTVSCVGPVRAAPNGRTVALFEGSLRFLRQVGLWDRFKADAQPIRAIRMVDDTAPFLPVPPILMEAREIGLDALGVNIENDRLVRGLAEAAAIQPGLTLSGALAASVTFAETAATVVDADGRRFDAALVIGADGRASKVRESARIASRSWRYAQVAITALVSHAKPHGEVSTEFHTRGGPCTLVPLAGTAESPHRSSLVWLMAPDEGDRRRALGDEVLARELEAQTRSVVGALKFEPARGFFPMSGLRVARLSGHRVALVGEAAHAFPPLAAQGLNLSLRDIAQLLATLEGARAEGRDLGLAASLRSFDRGRARDIALRTSGVDVLNRTIMTDFAPVDAARGVGAVVLRLVGPLRRALMREGIVPAGPRVPASRPSRP